MSTGASTTPPREATRRRARKGSALAIVGALAVLVLVVGASWLGRGTTTHGDDERCTALDQQHTAWTALLGQYVSDGVVDYAGLHAEAQPRLDAYLDALAHVCPADYDVWTEAQRLAFWINAYNAYTVRLILDHHPVGSIREIGVLPGAAFMHRFVRMRLRPGGAISLNDIEHEILRREFGEPRIHFAIVCASVSCPALRSEAYRAAYLDAQLDAAARGFVGDPSKNRLDAAANTLWLSAIFDWFAEDFERDEGSVLDFVARHADPPTAAAIAAGVEVKFLDYDWSLNGR